MRILVLTDGFPPSHAGGYEVSAYQLASSLSAVGEEVTVVTTRLETMTAELNPQLKVVRVLINYWSTARTVRFPKILHGALEVFHRLLNYRHNERALLSLLRRGSFDACIVFQVTSAGIQLAQTVASQKIPVLWSIGDFALIEARNYAPKARIAKLCYALLPWQTKKRYQYFHFENAVFNCDNTRRKFAQANIVPVNSWVIYRSCSIAEQPQYQTVKASRPCFLMASQIQEHKGHHIVIDALSKLLALEPEADWILNIVGRGAQDYLESLHEQVNSLGLSDRVQFLGHLQQPDVLNLMQGCVALISASTWDEPFGRVTMEALAQGTLLISSDTDAAVEVPTPECSLVYRKLDSTDLATKLQFALTRPNEARFIAEKGYRRAIETFHPDRERERYRAVLLRLICPESQGALEPIPPEFARKQEPLHAIHPEFF